MTTKVGDKSKITQHIDDATCKCAHCGNDDEFNLPEGIVDACLKGHLVIFAGAGISTEGASAFPTTFYEEIAYEAGFKPEESPSFPEAMAKFVKLKGRRALLQEIKKRLDYANAFRDVRWAATRFHKELSTIPYIKEIVTTNWDTFFEEEAGATPIVTIDDYAFWDMPDRKVFKVHGSISNIGTIVATTEDYKRCYRELSKGAIGGYLKHILATKTVVFVGYSFGDEDFGKIYRLIQREMGEIIPHSYVVTTSEDTKNTAKNSTIIRTDGRFFVSELKRALVERSLMLSDDRFETVNMLHALVKQAHLEIIDFDAFAKYPELVYTSSYQEGLIHLLERVNARRNTGEYSDEHHLGHMIHSYGRLLKGAIRSKRYFDAAYIEGYLNGLFALVIDEYADGMPIFYLYGYKDDIKNLRNLKKLLGKGNTPKAALKKAETIMKRQVGNLQPVHTSFLNGVEPI